MCRPVPCSNCTKTTWAGCGAHVDSVMNAVPASQRCTCARDTGKRGLLDRILGR